MLFTNEQGAHARGSFIDPYTVSSKWDTFGGQVTGRISGDLQTITWSNGTYWTRSFGSASSSGHSASTAAATPTPYPWHSIDWSSGTKRTSAAPIRVSSGWAAVKDDSMWVTGCIDFKNTSDVVAKHVRFVFTLENSEGDRELTVHFDREGTFSPNILIEGYGNLRDVFNRPGHHGFIENCWGQRYGETDEISRLRHVRYFTYSIERIDFADGTTWPA